MAATNINIEMLRKGQAEFYEFESNALVFKKQWTAAAKEATTKTAATSSVKVFTGLVSQGVLGSATSFTPRPDDLIQSTEELQTAAQNNLTPFLASLPGRVVYELKIVPSITTKDGFTQRGTSQQIISGYSETGTPKYRTVVNKFAVLHLYILTERGTRTKIATIVLGPTDALKFQPQQNALAAIESTIKQTVVTSNTEEITNIAPPPIRQIKTDGSYLRHQDGSLLQFWRQVGNELWTFEPVKGLLSEKEIQSAGSVGAALPLALKRLAEYGVNPENFMQPKNIADNIIAAQKAGTYSGKSFEEFFMEAPLTGGGIAGAPNGAGSDAATLFEWYQANGQQLPTVEARSLIYAGFGLGQASFYTGTAEQNTKLLAALKGK